MITKSKRKAKAGITSWRERPEYEAATAKLRELEERRADIQDRLGAAQRDGDAARQRREALERAEALGELEDRQELDQAGADYSAAVRAESALRPQIRALEAACQEQHERCQRAEQDAKCAQLEEFQAARRRRLRELLGALETAGELAEEERAEFDQVARDVGETLARGLKPLPRIAVAVPDGYRGFVEPSISPATVQQLRDYLLAD